MSKLVYSGRISRRINNNDTDKTFQQTLMKWLHKMHLICTCRETFWASRMISIDKLFYDYFPISQKPNGRVSQDQKNGNKRRRNWGHLEYPAGKQYG